MAEIINLKQVRKAKARAADKAAASANRAAHGLSKAQRKLNEAQRERAERLLDGTKRED